MVQCHYYVTTSDVLSLFMHSISDNYNKLLLLCTIKIILLQACLCCFVVDLNLLVMVILMNNSCSMFIDSNLLVMVDINE